MHVLHLCPNMKEFGKSIGWPHKEIPLNVTLRKSPDPDTGERKPLHETCPYCGCSLDPSSKPGPGQPAIKIASNEDVAYLSANYSHPTKLAAARAQRNRGNR